MESTQSSMNWSSYHNVISQGFTILQQREEFVDMTLAADGRFVKVHQPLLSLVSPYIKELLISMPRPSQYPVIFLDISYEILCYLVEYIYKGEVFVPDEKLDDFIRCSKKLHIKGIDNENTTEDVRKPLEPAEMKLNENCAKNREGPTNVNQSKVKRRWKKGKHELEKTGVHTYKVAIVSSKNLKTGVQRIQEAGDKELNKNITQALGPASETVENVNSASACQKAYQVATQNKYASTMGIDEDMALCPDNDIEVSGTITEKSRKHAQFQSEAAHCPQPNDQGTILETVQNDGQNIINVDHGASPNTHEISKLEVISQQTPKHMDLNSNQGTQNFPVNDVDITKNLKLKANRRGKQGKHKLKQTSKVSTKKLKTAVQIIQEARDKEQNMNIPETFGPEASETVENIISTSAKAKAYQDAIQNKYSNYMGINQDMPMCLEKDIEVPETVMEHSQIYAQLQADAAYCPQPNDQGITLETVQNDGQNTTNVDHGASPITHAISKLEVISQQTPKHMYLNQGTQEHNFPVNDVDITKNLKLKANRRGKKGKHKLKQTSKVSTKKLKTAVQIIEEARDKEQNKNIPETFRPEVSETVENINSASAKSKAYQDAIQNKYSNYMGINEDMPMCPEKDIEVPERVTEHSQTHAKFQPDVAYCPRPNDQGVTSETIQNDGENITKIDHGATSITQPSANPETVQKNDTNIEYSFPPTHAISKLEVVAQQRQKHMDLNSNQITQDQNLPVNDADTEKTKAISSDKTPEKVCKLRLRKERKTYCEVNEDGTKAKGRWKKGKHKLEQTGTKAKGRWKKGKHELKQTGFQKVTVVSAKNLKTAGQIIQEARDKEHNKSIPETLGPEASENVENIISASAFQKAYEDSIQKIISNCMGIGDDDKMLFEPPTQINQHLQVDHELLPVNQIQVPADLSENQGHIIIDQVLPVKQQYVPVYGELVPGDQGLVPVNQVQVPANHTANQVHVIADQLLPVEEQYNVPVYGGLVPVNQEQVQADQTANQVHIISNQLLPLKQQYVPVYEGLVPANQVQVPADQTANQAHIIYDQLLPVEQKYVPVYGGIVPADHRPVPADQQHVQSDQELVPVNQVQIPADLSANQEHIITDLLLPVEQRYVPVYGGLVPADQQHVQSDQENVPGNLNDVPADKQNLPVIDVTRNPKAMSSAETPKKVCNLTIRKERKTYCEVDEDISKVERWKKRKHELIPGKVVIVAAKKPKTTVKINQRARDKEHYKNIPEILEPEASKSVVKIDSVSAFQKAYLDSIQNMNYMGIDEDMPMGPENGIEVSETVTENSQAHALFQSDAAYCPRPNDQGITLETIQNYFQNITKIDHSATPINHAISKLEVISQQTQKHIDNLNLGTQDHNFTIELLPVEEDSYNLDETSLDSYSMLDATGENIRDLLLYQENSDVNQTNYRKEQPDMPIFDLQSQLVSNVQNMVRQTQGEGEIGITELMHAQEISTNVPDIVLQGPLYSNTATSTLVSEKFVEPVPKESLEKKFCNIHELLRQTEEFIMADESIYQDTNTGKEPQTE